MTLQTCKLCRETLC